MRVRVYNPQNYQKYYKENHEEILARAKRYYSLNKELIKERRIRKFFASQRKKSPV